MTDAVMGGKGALIKAGGGIDTHLGGPSVEVTVLVVLFDKVAVTEIEESFVTSLVAPIRGVGKEAAWFLVGETTLDVNDGVVDTMFTEGETAVTTSIEDTGVDTTTGGEEDCV